MPWVSVQIGSAKRGETFYMTTSVAPSKSYILRRQTLPSGDRDLWGVWRFGYYVQLPIQNPGLRWTEQFSQNLYARQHNYVTPAQGSVQAFAFFLPNRSPFPSVEFELWRFD